MSIRQEVELEVHCLTSTVALQLTANVSLSTTGYRSHRGSELQLVFEEPDALPESTALESADLHMLPHNRVLRGRWSSCPA